MSRVLPFTVLFCVTIVRLYVTIVPFYATIVLFYVTTLLEGPLGAIMLESLALAVAILLNLRWTFHGRVQAN
jgi:hypothetical protein